MEDEENKELWHSTIDKYNLNWVNASDLTMWESEIVRLYNIRSIPYNFLIDPQGKIIAKELYGHQLNNMLEKIL